MGNLVSEIIIISIILLAVVAATWFIIVFGYERDQQIKKEIKEAIQKIENIVKSSGGLNPKINLIPLPETSPAPSYRLFNVVFVDVNGKSYEYEVKQNLDNLRKQVGDFIWNQDSDGPVVMAKPMGSKEQIIDNLSEENSDLKKEIEKLRSEFKNQGTSG